MRKLSAAPTIRCLLAEPNLSRVVVELPSFLNLRYFEKVTTYTSRIMKLLHYKNVSDARPLAFCYITRKLYRIFNIW